MQSQLYSSLDFKHHYLSTTILMFLTTSLSNFNDLQIAYFTRVDVKSDQGFYFVPAFVTASTWVDVQETEGAIGYNL